MNPLVRHIASGDAFLTGSALVSVALVARPWTMRRSLRFLLTIATCLGVVLAVLSATPLPWWLYGSGVSLALLALAADRGREVGPADGAIEHPPAAAVERSDARGGRRRLPLVVQWAAILAWCAGMVWELPQRVVPRVPVWPSNTLFVIGDSVSAGLDEGETTWPALLASTRPVVVRDFSHVGATVQSALNQAERVDGPGLVLVEIGGNDVLGPAGGTHRGDFEAHLDALLQRLTGGDRLVVMLELPLPPCANEYGAIQRRIAGRHRAILIPKRIFLNVLAHGGATVDSIHLSPKGQALLADTIWSIVGPSCPPVPAAPEL